MTQNSSVQRLWRRKGASLLTYIVLGAILAFVAFASWSALNYSVGGGTQAAKGAGRVYPAPDFNLRLLDGSELALSDLRGKAVVVNFWASWCPPCRAEAPDLERVWQAYKDKGVVFLGVNIQDTEQNARAFMEEFAITYPNGQDAGDRISKSYGITGIPETFFITRDGLVNRHWIGPVSENQLAGFVEDLLQ